MATRQSPRTRAKDGDRDDTCKILDGALEDGQLSMEEHRTRVASATSAATLGDLQALIDDLQTADAPVRLPDLGRPAGSLVAGVGNRWIRATAVAVALLVVGIVIGWGLYGNTSSPLSLQTDPGAKADGIPAKVLTPPRQLHSLGGLTGLFEQMRRRFGDTQGYRLVVYPDYAPLDRADPHEPRRVLDYVYRGGWGDSTSSSAKDGDDVLVDLAAIDVPAIVGILRGAPETLGIEPADVKTTYLVIDPAKNPVTPGELTLSIYVTGELGGSGYLQVDGLGRPKGMTLPTR